MPALRRLIYSHVLAAIIQQLKNKRCAARQLNVAKRVGCGSGHGEGEEKKNKKKKEWRGLRHYWGLINGQEMFLCVASTGKSYSRVEKTTKIVDNKVFGAGGEKMLQKERGRKGGTVTDRR